MDSRTTANLYYDAWQNRAGDMTAVPLADDFRFTGPVASFDSADGFRAMAARAGAAVRGFTVRHQFTDGDLVCSVIDWEMTMLPGVLTAAEILEIRDGTIVAGELIYDAENLRKAMAPKPFADLIGRSIRDVAELFGRIDEAGWAAASPCAEWTVRQTGNHLIGSVVGLVRTAEGERVTDADLEPQRLADTDWLGSEPAKVANELADRAVAAFSRPGILEARFDQPVPEASGEIVANAALLESLVHAWDVAAGAGAAFRPDPEVVAAVRAFSLAAVGDTQRRPGVFGPAVVTLPEADQLTELLGHLGRRAG
jgi:uncharacterized protein (TIGR03086 family)